MPQEVRLPYRNRIDAARAMAPFVARQVHDDERDRAIVLALPRGGVPLGYEIAGALGLPLDLMLVRKLGVPGHEELAAGAIASGGVQFINEEVMRLEGLTPAALEPVTRREREELERRDRTYRGDRPPPRLEGRTVILVDDGLATGATMSAAVQACRAGGAARVLVAVPVGSSEAVRRLRGEADEVICPATPPYFTAIGQFYEDFSQTDDDEVRDLLARAWNENGEDPR